VILADTSVWVDHLRGHDATLADLLAAGRVLGHPFVLGELACGVLRQRADVLSLLGRLPQAAAASDAEALGFVERHRLMGAGIGWVDAHLLASAALTTGARLWTRDRRLAAAARRLELHARPDV
jgi:hypothetical protein